jgi:hypothetical protein
MGSVSKTFSESSGDAAFEMYLDAFSQLRVSKALFQHRLHLQACYSCARRSRAACRSGVSNPSVNQA